MTEHNHNRDPKDGIHADAPRAALRRQAQEKAAALKPPEVETLSL
jgi:hypothetical protein